VADNTAVCSPGVRRYLGDRHRSQDSPEDSCKEVNNTRLIIHVFLPLLIAASLPLAPIISPRPPSPLAAPSPRAPLDLLGTRGTRLRLSRFSQDHHSIATQASRTFPLPFSSFFSSALPSIQHPLEILSRNFSFLE
jgi:hypothetical protein